MPRGIVKYVPVDNCPDPNYPAAAPAAPVTKTGTPTAPELPPTGVDFINTFIDQAAKSSIRFSNMTVGYFKLDLTNTKSNMYGEAIEKWYYPPVEVRCLIERGDFAYTDTEYGPDINQTLTLTIPKITLAELNFLPEVGDIVTDQERYYEVHDSNRSFITIPGTGRSESTVGTPGQIVVYKVTAHLTRTTKLNLIEYS